MTTRKKGKPVFNPKWDRYSFLPTKDGTDLRNSLQVDPHFDFFTKSQGDPKADTDVAESVGALLKNVFEEYFETSCFLAAILTVQDPLNPKSEAGNWFMPSLGTEPYLLVRDEDRKGIDDLTNALDPIAKQPIGGTSVTFEITNQAGNGIPAIIDVRLDTKFQFEAKFETDKNEKNRIIYCLLKTPDGSIGETEKKLLYDRLFEQQPNNKGLLHGFFEETKSLFGNNDITNEARKWNFIDCLVAHTQPLTNNPRHTTVRYGYFPLLAPPILKRVKAYPEWQNPHKYVGSLILVDSPKPEETFSTEYLNRCWPFVSCATAVASWLVSMKLQMLAYKHQTKSGINTVINRNLSHNIGSHVLCCATEEVIKSRCKEYAEFQRYLQERMDFTAQMAGGAPSSEEPMLLVNDILRHFFKQTFLLDFLIRDDQYPGVCIEFEVSLELSDCDYKDHFFVTYKESNDDDGIKLKCNLSAKDDESPPDPLVRIDPVISVPGGIVGKHAIYALLENAIRNSAKYGKTLNNGQKLRIKLNFTDANDGKNDPCCTGEDRGSFLLMRYSDNVTAAPQCKNQKKPEHEKVKCDCLNCRLCEPLIGETGEITLANWGLQEMKAYASYLAGATGIVADVKFQVNADADDANDNPALLWYGAEEICMDTTTPQTPGEAGVFRTIRLGLRKARLLQVISTFPVDEDKKKWRNKGVFFTPVDKGLLGEEDSKKKSDQFMLSHIMANRPSLLLFLTDDNKEADSYIQFVARHHPKLPGRLLISLPNGASKGTSKSTEWTLNKDHSCIALGSDPLEKKDDGAREYKPYLPKRRLFFCYPPVSNDTNDPDTLIIDAYAAFVAAFIHKGVDQDPERRLNVGIYWDKANVNNALKTVSEYSLLQNRLKIAVKIFDQIQSEDNYLFENEVKPTIFFDNHSNGIGKLSTKHKPVLSLQRIGGNGTPTNDNIDRLLRHVSEGISGVLTLLGLVESALSNIACMDERVIRMVVRKGTDGLQWNQFGKELLYARVWPLIQVCNVGDVRTDSRECLPDFNRKTNAWEGGGNVPGFVIQTESSCVDMVQLIKDNEYREPNVHLDAIVIHRGWLESDKALNLDILARSLYKYAARVIWSTGRSIAGQNGYEEAVIEASALTSNLTQDFSKYHLIRSLSSVWKGEYYEQPEDSDNRQTERHMG